MCFADFNQARRERKKVKENKTSVHNSAALHTYNIRLTEKPSDPICLWQPFPTEKNPPRLLPETNSILRRRLLLLEQLYVFLSPQSKPQNHVSGC